MSQQQTSTAELQILDQVIQGDCRSVLETLPEESIDLIFADPPYNLQLQQELWRPNLTRVDAVDDDWDHFGSFAEYDQFTREWLQACRRVLKRSGTLWVIGTYHNIFRVGTILQDLGYWTLNDVVWIKTNPMPNFRGVRFTNAHETLIWAQKEHGIPYTFNHHAMKSLNEELQMRSDWLLPICSGKERLREDGHKVHPTQKPEPLLYRIISASSNPGDVILDPFFGTGTTGTVAKRLHRHWIGIERNEHYVDVARRRIDKELQTEFDPPLFVSPSPRRELRIAFGSLLENGLIKPGQTLYFGPQTEIKACVLADGKLEYQGQQGSIHQIASLIRKGPSNGWEAWYYLETETQEYRVINDLRQKVRLETT
jgi:site-specific DNA-methyltransferase (adenine-specific)